MTVSEATQLTYVRIAEAHLAEVMAIEEEAYPEPWSEGMFLEEVQSPRSRFFVAFLGEQMAGYGGFWLVLDEAHITSVTIRQELRGLGYGRQLLRFLMDTAVGLGVKLATLEVRASNTRAQGLYVSEGFTAVGRRKDYYPKTREDAIVMLKELGDE